MMALEMLCIPLIRRRGPGWDKVVVHSEKAHLNINKQSSFEKGKKVIEAEFKNMSKQSEFELLNKLRKKKDNWSLQSDFEDESSLDE